MRTLLEAIGKPFFVHIWDFLDGAPVDDPNWRWILTRAEIVYSLNSNIDDSVLELRKDCRRLLFSRKKAKVVAKYSKDEFRILLIGYLPPYVDGLKLLFDSLQIDPEIRRKAKIVCIGHGASIRLVQSIFSENLELHGFLESDDERDEIIGSCHCAYLPGPTQDPAFDSRSQYSIPSRVLDYFACGLPTVAPVHPQSATAKFLKEWLPDSDTLIQDPTNLMKSIQRLQNPNNWELEHRRSLEAFTLLQGFDSPSILASALQS